MPVPAGHQYDLKNVLDLARYLLPTPPVPVGWRRRLLALGSGDPTRAICSTLIAQCFAEVRYPILPQVETLPVTRPDCPDCVQRVHHVRHHSLYVPRDFDVSPYFQIIKPTLTLGFDFHRLMGGGGRLRVRRAWPERSPGREFRPPVCCVGALGQGKPASLLEAGGSG